MIWGRTNVMLKRKTGDYEMKTNLMWPKENRKDSSKGDWVCFAFVGLKLNDAHAANAKRPYYLPHLS